MPPHRSRRSGKPEVRLLSSSVSIAFLSVASNNAAVLRLGGGEIKKSPQTKGSGGADVSGARQVVQRPCELAHHLFYQLPANGGGGVVSKLRHLFV